MEFKFSCKWFEVGFSGDPGYVEIQLAKYDPFIQAVLKKLPEALARETEPETAAPKPPAREPVAPNPHPAHAPAQGQPANREPNREANREQNRDQNRDRSRRDGRHQRNEPDRRGRPQPFDARPRDAVPPSRPQGFVKEGRDDPDDSSEPETRPPLPGEQAAPEPAAPAELPFPETPAESPAPAPALAGPDLAPIDDQTPRPKNPAADFAARRRVPSIRAEELTRMIEDKRPRTHHDRIMVFGFYMETQGGGTDFTIAEVKRCYRAVGQDPGVNIEQVINHASRSGFILRDDLSRTPRYKLSNKGRGYVEDGLRLS